jgi:hypothetical protein
MSSTREPLPKAAVVRANKSAPPPPAQVVPPTSCGEAVPFPAEWSLEVKKKPKKPRAGPSVHVEDAAAREYSRTMTEVSNYL